MNGMDAINPQVTHKLIYTYMLCICITTTILTIHILLFLSIFVDTGWNTRRWCHTKVGNRKENGCIVVQSRVY